MNEITLTHANDGKKLCFYPPTIFYYYYSTAHACTHIVSNGGAFAPVRETVEDVKRLLSQTGAKEAPSNGS